MKKQMVCLIAVFGLIFGHSLFAREIVGYGARGIVGISGGSFGDFVGTGIGGVGTVFYEFDDKLMFTGSAGFVRFGGDNSDLFGTSVDLNWTVIPLMSGARYYLSEEDASSRFYVGGDLGYFIVSVSGGGLFGSTAGSSELTLGPAAGVQLGKIDLRAVYYLNSIQYLALEVGVALTK